jgi:hypothetical protein
VHALLQQKPSTQKPLVHWLPTAQAAPFEARLQTIAAQPPAEQSAAIAHPFPRLHVLPRASQSTPPQSTSVSLPSLTPSVHETHVPGLLPKQSWWAQSELTLQCLTSPHGGHAGAPMKPPPPQSTSVSFPF